MGAPLLDLVAVAYEAPEETAAFLRSLAHLDVPYRLLVIENYSPGMATLDAIRKNIPDDAHIITNTENVGYARAVNQGMSFWAHPAPYAAILNCDVQFIEGEKIQQIIDAFETFPDIGVIGPRTRTSNGKLTHAGIVTTDAEPRNHHRGWMEPDLGQYKDALEVNTVSGATYFVRTKMWLELTECADYQRAAKAACEVEATGAFLPTKHFFEETFCSYHARQHGWRVVYMGSVAMIHEWHRSSKPGSQSFLVPQAQFARACIMCGIDMAGEVE